MSYQELARELLFIVTFRNGAWSNFILTPS